MSAAASSKDDDISTPPHKNPVDLSDNARTVMVKRYIRKDPDGNPIEDEHEMFWRIAKFVDYGDRTEGTCTKLAYKYYDLLTSLQFLPNTPTFMGAGTPLGQLAACFVLPIEDDMGKTPGGIFQTLRDAALIQQTGGGNGFAFSRLRPAKSLVNSSMGQASGPVGFLRVYDQAFGEVAQGGTRRGANMAVLRCDHPDIMEFINCKTSEHSITNFNISVGITDEFMEAVEKDGSIDLKAPHTGEVYETVKARKIFDAIAEKAHHNGEPGVLFLDTANKANPVPHLYELESTNPCGEQWLGPYESCCLGSINLAKHKGVKDGKNVVNWDLLEKTVQTSTYFLDDVISANNFVPSVPQLKEAAEKCRRIGLGIMGLADLMFHCGITYGSPDGRTFGRCIMEFIRFHSMMMSIELASLIGKFPGFKGSIYDQGDGWIPSNAGECNNYANYSFNRPKLDWGRVTRGIQEWGIRNAAQTTIAPTGTISTVAGCEGYGCEPVFALAYYRHVNDRGEDLQLRYVSPEFEAALRSSVVPQGGTSGVLDSPENRGSSVIPLRGTTLVLASQGSGVLASQGSSKMSEEDISEILDAIADVGSIRKLDPSLQEKIPDHIRQVFVTSEDVSWQNHIEQQAALQEFVDNSISKTINMPNDATVEDVKEAYRLAYTKGCKGLTVYRTGSRSIVVLETKETKDGKDPVQKDSKSEVSSSSADPTNHTQLRKPRPRKLTGETHRVETPLGVAYVTVNENPEDLGQPFEVFLQSSKAGSDTAAVTEALGRLISQILRMNSPLSPRDRLGEIIHQMRGIGGQRSTGLGPRKVRSLPDGIAKALREYMIAVDPDGIPADMMASSSGLSSPEIPTASIGDLCPECGQATYIYTEGCKKCTSCGLSEC